jgi:hypothetical protein
MKAVQAVVTLMLAVGLPANARDFRSTQELLKKGASLTAPDAAKLEERVKEKPDDDEARIQLLSYYAGPQPAADLPAVKAARARHILWLIANDPKDGLGLFPAGTGVYRMHCAGMISPIPTHSCV